ncbi:MAG: hypothetical protein H7259_03840, partial [Cytophagales bacterium]|nr:hypothetical protein [Cytophaga sp.]
MKKVSIMSITVRILIVFFVLNHGIMASAQISSSYSSNTQWHKLGSVYANDGMQKYVVQVGTANAYETLKLTVQDVPTEIIEIIVIYN